MNKYRVEFQANGTGFQTIDEFMEIEAETADEAIGFAVDWMNEHLIPDYTDGVFMYPKDMEWRAGELM